MQFVVIGIGILIYVGYYLVVHKLLPYIGYWMYMEANRGD